jgi:hypothetical protein
MTRNHAVIAGAASIILVVAVAVFPSVHHDRATAPRSVNYQQMPSPAMVDEITTVATVAARRALACHPPGRTAPPAERPQHAWCGRFTSTREQTACSNPSRCQVELIGTFTSTDASTVVAMTVEVRRTAAGGWQIVGVSS